MRRYTIWDEIRKMQEQIDSVFENFFSQAPESRALLRMPETEKSRELVLSDFRPALLDMWEDEKNIYLEAELPGIDKKDIKVSIDDDSVEIRAETRFEEKRDDKKKGYYRLERRYAGFYRCLELPKSVDKEKAKAEFNNGILKITMPKVKSEEQSKKEIKVE
ncbi:MAG: Hsp20/alpha crystallin family protein [Candidatus Micrarchaeota archaeon]|nr:Hsp20/alpha crystallin family protein [Candidatus Micrarchaeota archaeon]